MSGMWLPLGLLSVLAMLFVLVPVWRHRVQRGTQQIAVRQAKNREVFAQRQLELEREVEAGLVAPEDHQRMLAELQRAFLIDMQGVETQATAPAVTAPSRWLPIVVALLLPILAIVVYQRLGAAEDLKLPALVEAARNAQSEEQQVAALNELAAHLERRLERNPDDLQNGYMLGTLYLGIDRYQDAATAFEKMLREMEPNQDRATVLGQLAQARYMLADSVITPDVQSVMDEATALNPNEQAVMSLYAIDAFLKEDFVSALRFWRRQLSDLTPGSRDAEQLRERIALVEANLPADQLAEVRGPMIEVVVDVSALLAAKVTDNMQLFVFARMPNARQPIAAQMVPLPQFPYTLTLDNTASMAGAQLEQGSELVVGARLTTAGATGQSGDLETLSQPFVLGEQAGPLSLIIDSIKP